MFLHVLGLEHIISNSHSSISNGEKCLEILWWKILNSLSNISNLTNLHNGSIQINKYNYDETIKDDISDVFNHYFCEVGKKIDKYNLKNTNEFKNIAKIHQLCFCNQWIGVKS